MVHDASSGGGAMTPADPPSAELPASEPFTIEGFHGELVVPYRPVDLERELSRILDPAAAEETVHWGRNYLYRTHLETTAGRIDVVVKQFRNQGLKARLRRRYRGSKALASWTMARAFQAAGIPTAEALLRVESDEDEGPSFFVSRHLGEMIEVRYLLRAVNAERGAEEFPSVDFPVLFEQMGRALHRMHERGFFHRDLSIGNLLVSTAPFGGDPKRRGAPSRPLGTLDLAIIDLNRARRPGTLDLVQRTRDLCRLAIFRPEHQELFLRGYWGDALDDRRRRLYRRYHRGFLFKIESKKILRAPLRRLLEWIRPRRAHAHIPAAPASASSRDKIVWDHLSDQPHQHASKLEKLSVRLRDAPAHLAQYAALATAMPRIWRRYRALKKALYRTPLDWPGCGICVRPHPEDPEALLRALDDLGCRQVLLRLQPWDDDHDHEEDLARAIHQRGWELTFALPQNRDLVNDPERWSTVIEELAERFTPFGRSFQVGQAVNRSKWGIWRIDDYFDLADRAAKILRRYPGTQILGPAVIDFELHVTAGLLNLRRCPVRFDALASLLYVDRRGAPENTQLGFDTVGKTLLLQAIAETSPHCGPRSWITEVNWPLWEGPHSPAGKSVSVDEETQADYLARFYLLALTTGQVERVFWWQLTARGYGLMTPEEGVLRRRPAFQTLATLERQLRGARFERPLDSTKGQHLLLFRAPDGHPLVTGWCESGKAMVTLPGPVTHIVERDGGARGTDRGTEAQLTASVRYFHLGD